MLERIKLVEERFARAEQVAFQFAIDLEHERGLRLVVGVISGEEVGKELVIFVNRIDRRTKKAGLAAQVAEPRRDQTRDNRESYKRVRISF